MHMTFKFILFIYYLIKYSFYIRFVNIKTINIYFYLSKLQGDIDLCDPNDGIDSDGSASSSSGKQVFVGICAMGKKSQSKPMKEILTRLQEFEYLRMIVFPEEVILKVMC